MSKFTNFYSLSLAILITVINEVEKPITEGTFKKILKQTIEQTYGKLNKVQFKKLMKDGKNAFYDFLDASEIIQNSKLLINP